SCPSYARSSTPRPPRASPAGSPFSVEQVLQGRFIEFRFGQQPLELRVLLLELLQPSRLRHRHPGVLRLPVVEGCFRNAVPATQVLRLRSRLGFLQYRNDLFFAKSLCLHRPLLVGRTLLL